jgi:hypothetical protein
LLLDTPLLRRSTLWPPILRLFCLYTFPVATRSELDVFANTRSVWLWTLGLALLEAELRPGAALCDGGVDLFFVDGCAGLAGNFDFAAGVVDAVGDCGLGAVFVDGCGGLRKGGGVGVGVGDIVGPVWAAGWQELLVMSARERADVLEDSAESESCRGQVDEASSKGCGDNARKGLTLQLLTCLWISHGLVLYNLMNGFFGVVMFISETGYWTLMLEHLDFGGRGAKSSLFCRRAHPRLGQM